ncbi:MULTISPECIES: betaine/proline/choline family ABC transporter ATP-binding protein [unclassified Mesorhizobium]|uniref:quaternary amine ABC transporter ATP-binding protein n=1 Tax=unclassified Mesorhizobium TaxID=325217 RepID=UPI00086B86E6|nr:MULTISPECIES: betaine/proline/choline family ABC transporter ATP-binding protein [unclassified Mesorhizobium]MBN9253069.1 betaine/proline/choline family ABC transporter ATP-binding protein [Mesorhizobium sp.]ODT16525.1 MAG: ABC transporter ATP-binding protein [Mesorhizobium sp. SCN 65-12]OJX71538.1 MAG: ABC transporter ATP-binding protein [Mesorhizobium sp. 65-26]
MASSSVSQRRVALACHDLWKLYGPDPRRAMNAVLSHGNDRERQRAALARSAHVAAVAGVSLEVHEAEIFVLMGLSGSGKSTLLRCLTRLIEPTSGRVLLDGEDLEKAGRKRMIELRRHAMGMVFQNFGLLPHLNVLDNVAFPLRVQGVDTEKRYARAREMTELVGLSGLEASFPNQLSGGQQQRVGIARSLAVGPQVWFLDEPFSALDPLIRRQMQDEFIRLQKMLRKTIVFVTHDVQEAFRLADRIAIMRDGAIVQMGTPAEIALSPANDYIAEFLRDIPTLRAIKAADVMQPLSDTGRPARTVPATELVEAILPMILDDASPIGVLDAAGTLAGQITTGRIAELARHGRA